MRSITSNPNTPIRVVDMIDKYKDEKKFGGESNDFDCPKLKKNKFYIILMRDEEKTSGHFCCILCGDKDCFYFEAFGLPPDLYVYNRMRELYPKNKCLYSTFSYQAFESNRCGYYVMYVIDCWLKGMTYSQILTSLNKVSEEKE